MPREVLGGILPKMGTLDVLSERLQGQSAKYLIPTLGEGVWDLKVFG